MNESEAFLEAQEHFLTEGNQKAWAVMWMTAETITRRCLTLELHEKNLQLDSDTREDVVFNTVEYVLRRYRTRPGYRIEYPVTTMQFGIKHALYSRNFGEIVFQNAIALLNQNKALSFEQCLEIEKAKVEKLMKKKKLKNKLKKEKKEGYLSLFSDEEQMELLET